MRYLDDVDPRGANQHGASAPGADPAKTNAQRSARARAREVDVKKIYMVAPPK